MPDCQVVGVRYSFQMYCLLIKADTEVQQYMKKPLLTHLYFMSFFFHSYNFPPSLPSLTFYVPLPQARKVPQCTYFLSLTIYAYSLACSSPAH